MSIWNQHPGIKADPERRWATVAELDAFDRMVDAGVITFFRTGTCARDGCGRDIPDAKDYCSKACHDEDTGAQEEDDGE